MFNHNVAELQHVLHRNEKGITIIALIITIIILVILAAVSINAAYNSGIVNYAVNGTQNYLISAKEEQIKIASLEELITGQLNPNASNSEDGSIFNNCNISISNIGDITVSGVTKLKEIIIVKDGKYFDSCKTNNYRINTPVGVEANIYVIAIDEDMNLYKSSTLQYTAKVVPLYYKGTEYTNIAVGASGSWGVTLSKRDTFLYGSGNDTSTGAYCSPVFYMINNIDVTNIDKIYIHFFDCSMSTEDVTIFGTICNNYDSTYLRPADSLALDKRALQVMDNEEFTLEIDVSTIEGVKNVSFGGQTDRDNQGYGYNNNYIGYLEFKIDDIYYTTKN